MIAYLIIIFFFAYVSLFSLKTAYRSTEPEQIRYCYTSRDKFTVSELHLTAAGSIQEIQAPSSDTYVYISGTLPQVQHRTLVIHSLNGTARIGIAGETVFDSLSEKTLAGSSYIALPLDGSMSGEELEILLYSPLSDSFEVELLPAGETVFSASNLPYAFAAAVIGLIAVFAVSLTLSLDPRRGRPQAATLLMLASPLPALAVFVLEHLPLQGTTHYLFNLKLFLWLLIPILLLLEVSLRYGEWSTRSEAVLSANILYALSIVFLWKNVFFFVLLYSGVFLQAVNLLLAMSILLKHARAEEEYYGAAAALFWGLNLLLWAAVALHKVSWQPTVFITAVFFLCLCNALGIFRSRRKERQDAPPPVSEATPSPEGALSESTLPNGLQIPQNCRLAFNAFHDRILEKIYIREGHSLKVSEYSRIISSYMGMSRAASDEISRAAALHDIGKLCVSEAVLYKSERLTEAEFEEIKKHVIYGYKLLSSDEPFFKMAALVAREHHEHIDGSGYMGLKGAEISLPAKIVAVADVFDALVSKRSYKESWSFDEAVAYIREHAADYFDKSVVEAFIRAQDKICELYSAEYPAVQNRSSEERN